MRNARYVFSSIIRSRISPGVLANTCSRVANNKVGEAEHMTDGDLGGRREAHVHVYLDAAVGSVLSADRLWINPENQEMMKAS